MLASLGGAICHRPGVFDIALEGFILMGAFAAVLETFMLGHVFWGVLSAILAGIFMGLLFAEFHLRRPGDAIVVSIALNLIGLGLTTYLLRSVLGVSGVFQDEALGKITEINVAETLKEVRRALLEADVALSVVKDFIENVKPKAIGQEIIRSTSPGQMIVNIVFDELVSILGSKREDINIKTVPPVSILLVGLQLS